MHEATDDERSTLGVVVLARSDEVKLLVGTVITSLDLDRDQILPEVASSRVDAKASAIGRLKLDVGEGTDSGIITAMTLGRIRWPQGTTST